jgi:hypothetical protein
MKKIIITSLFLAAQKISFSQTLYAHYLDATSEWRFFAYNEVSNPVVYDSYTLYFDGDTVINGNAYYIALENHHKIFEDRFTLARTYSDYIQRAGFVREDSNGIFYWNNDVWQDHQQLLNSQVDSVFPTWTMSGCYIDSIDTVYLGSVPLKRILSNGSFLSYAIEGIGNIRACVFILEGGGGIACYSKGGDTLSFDDSDCSAYPPALRGVSSISELNKLFFTVSPNPTQNTLRVNFDLPNHNYDYGICNLHGEKIMSGVLKAGEIIDISSLAAGVYVLAVSNKYDMQRQKVIKR